MDPTAKASTTTPIAKTAGGAYIDKSTDAATTSTDPETSSARRGPLRIPDATAEVWRQRGQSRQRVSGM